MKNGFWYSSELKVKRIIHGGEKAPQILINYLSIINFLLNFIGNQTDSDIPLNFS